MTAGDRLATVGPNWVDILTADVHFARGPFGKLHVRHGKATKGSIPGPGGCRCSEAWAWC